VEYQLSDPRGRLVPPITFWILKQCDLNKDVPITDKAQVTLPDVQLSTASKVFRSYVKNLNGQAHYRVEDSLQVNQTLKFFESALYPQKEITSKLDAILAILNKQNNQNEENR